FLLQEPLDAGAHVDLVHRLDAADKFEGLADALEAGNPHADRGRWRCRGRWRGLAGILEQQPTEPCENDNRNDPEHAEHARSGHGNPALVWHGTPRLSAVTSPQPRRPLAAADTIAQWAA